MSSSSHCWVRGARLHSDDTGAGVVVRAGSCDAVIAEAKATITANVFRGNRGEAIAGRPHSSTPSLVTRRSSGIGHGAGCQGAFLSGPTDVAYQAVPVRYMYWRDLYAFLSYGTAS